MKLRQARKIAARAIAEPGLVRDCPWDEMQLFRAYSRLHTAWRQAREVRKDDDGRITHGVTPDYERANRLWRLLIRQRYFRRGKFVQPDPAENPAIKSWMLRTWSPPQS